MVGGEYVLAAVDDERGGAGHRVDHPFDARAHGPPGRAAPLAGRPVAGGAGQVEEMSPLGFVQAERPRDRSEDTVRDAGQAAALHPVVVVDADPGQGRDLLAPQSGDLPRSVGGEADLPGRDLRAPRGEEVPHFGLRVHLTEVNPRPRSRGCPVSTWTSPSSRPAPESCLPEGTANPDHQHRRTKCRSPETASRRPWVPIIGLPGTSTSTSSARRRRPRASWAESSTSRRALAPRGTPTRPARRSSSPRGSASASARAGPSRRYARVTASTSSPARTTGTAPPPRASTRRS